MPKKLKIWNGRGWGRGDYNCPEGHSNEQHYPFSVEYIYVCARSRAEAGRILYKYGRGGYYDGSAAANEIKNYFSEGCWGNRMNDIEPEVGLWVTVNGMNGGGKEIICIWKESDPDVLKFKCSHCDKDAVWYVRSPGEWNYYVCDDHHEEDSREICGRSSSKIKAFKKIEATKGRGMKIQNEKNQ